MIRTASQEQQLTVDIPSEWLAGLDWQPNMLQEVIQIGIQQLKIRQALALYQAGGCSLGYVAEKFQIPRQALIIAARAKGIEPLFTETTVQEELGELINDI
ncbi:hypothetical protein QUF58_10640 [Anaerolineales bacterium HSG24]|nr:hypothetical protein [Anaerolineales bacterium HSG24]